MLAVAKAGDERKVVLQSPYHVAHPNFLWWKREAQPPGAATDPFHESSMDQALSHFHEMVLRNAVSIREFCDGHQALGHRPQGEEHPKAKIGVSGEFHEDLSKRSIYNTAFMAYVNPVTARDVS